MLTNNDLWINVIFRPVVTRTPTLGYESEPGPCVLLTLHLRRSWHEYELLVEDEVELLYEVLRKWEVVATHRTTIDLA